MDLTPQEQAQLKSSLIKAANNYKALGYKGVSGLYFNPGACLIGHKQDALVLKLNTTQSTLPALLKKIQEQVQGKVTTLPHLTLGHIIPELKGKQDTTNLIANIGVPKGAKSLQDSFQINSIKIFKTVGYNKYQVVDTIWL